MHFFIAFIIFRTTKYSINLWIVLIHVFPKENVDRPFFLSGSKLLHWTEQALGMQSCASKPIGSKTVRWHPKGVCCCCCTSINCNESESPPCINTSPAPWRVCLGWGAVGRRQDSGHTSGQGGAEEWMQLTPPARELVLNPTSQAYLSNLKSCKVLHNAAFHMYGYSACKLFYSSTSAFLYFGIMYMM